MRPILCIVLFVLPNLVYSQQEEIKIAKQFLKNKDYKSAIPHIDRAAENPATKVQAQTWFLRGEIYLGEYTNSPNLKSLQIARDSYVESKKLKTVEQIETLLIERLTTIADLFLREGVNNYNQKNFEGAIKNFESTISLKHNLGLGEDEIALYNLALSLEEVGKKQEAVSLYEKCIGLNYKQESCYLSIMMIYQELNNITEGLNIAQVAHKSFPKNTQILSSLINMEIQSGDLKSANNHLREIVQSEATNKVLWFTYASTSQAIGSIDEAEKAFLKALEIDANYFEAMYNLGALYYNQGVELNNQMNKTSDPDLYLKLQNGSKNYFEKAEEQLEAAHDINPNDQTVIQSLVQIYSLLNRTKKHKEMSKKLKN